MMVQLLMLLPVFVLMVHSPRQGQVPENVSSSTAGVAATGEQLVCNDGTAPDVTTGLCADGSQPQASAVNETELPANGSVFSQVQQRRTRKMY